jgi:hypothetical protein
MTLTKPSRLARAPREAIALIMHLAYVPFTVRRIGCL